MIQSLRQIPILPKLLLKTLLIMLIPLNFTIFNLQSILSLPLAGLLFTPWESYGVIYLEYSSYSSIPSLIQILSNIGIGLLLAGPGIYFNYRVSSSPANRPFRNLAIAITIFSTFVTFLALMMITSLGYIYLNYQLMMNIMTFPTLVICFFIILPMIQRQATLIAVPEELHSNTIRELERIPGLSVRRENILASLLWACLCFLPYFMLTYSYSFYLGYTSFYSFAFTFSTGYSYYLISEYSAISGSAMMLFSLPVFGIMSSIRFVYVRDIYRHLKHEISYRRMLYMGILGDFFPVISFTMINMVLASAVVLYYSILPIPALVFIGLLIARLHKSVLPYANRVWVDVDARMWFEDQVERPPVTQIAERPFRHAEETITVPIRYLVTSQIRKRIRGDRQRHSGKG